MRPTGDGRSRGGRLRPDAARRDPARIALAGWSFGGYLAPRAAAGEPRLAALIADPGQWDLIEAIRAGFARRRAARSRRSCRTSPRRTSSRRLPPFAQTCSSTGPSCSAASWCTGSTRSWTTCAPRRLSPVRPRCRHPLPDARRASGKRPGRAHAERLRRAHRPPEPSSVSLPPRTPATITRPWRARFFSASTIGSTACSAV